MNLWCQEIAQWLPKAEIWGTKGVRNYKEARENIIHDGNVHYLDCNDSFTGVGIYQNLSNCIF